jgi:hypothetical protein
MGRSSFITSQLEIGAVFSVTVGQIRLCVAGAAKVRRSS